jgi:hypothetical protein
MATMKLSGSRIFGRSLFVKEDNDYAKGRGGFLDTATFYF